MNKALRGWLSSNGEWFWPCVLLAAFLGFAAWVVEGQRAEERACRLSRCAAGAPSYVDGCCYCITGIATPAAEGRS